MNHYRVCPKHLALWLVPLVLASCTGAPTDEEPTESAAQALYGNGLFELDGNVADAPSPGDDWSAVLLGVSSTSIRSTGVLADPGQASVFTGGGSKDLQDLDTWRWNDGPVPDKDNITNSFAAAYGANGEVVIYFGVDRFAQYGDTQLGFWFLQNDVSLSPDGSFNGVHAVGDILVLSDFSNGGAVATAKVFTWVGSGGSDGALDLVEGGAALGNDNGNEIFCLADEHFCASINRVPQPAPWAYQPRSGTPNTIPRGGFFEGGINISQLVPATTCLASVVAETRSSRSPTASLRDFTIGALRTCGIAVTQACAVVSVNTEPGKLFIAEYAVTVTNDGVTRLPAGTVLTVTDDAGTPSDTSDDVQQALALAAELPAGQSVTLPPVQIQTDENPPTSTVTVQADVGATTLSAEPSSVACQPLL